MATRKHMAPAAAETAADPSQDAQPAPAGMAAIPAAAGGLTASQQAYGEQGEQGEMQQLRMQMHMDRKQKADQTMSNTSKKMAESADNITDNMK